MWTVSLLLRLAIQQGQLEEDNWHFATRVLCNNGTRENSLKQFGCLTLTSLKQCHSFIPKGAKAIWYDARRQSEKKMVPCTAWSMHAHGNSKYKCSRFVCPSIKKKKTQELEPFGVGGRRSKVWIEGLTWDEKAMWAEPTGYSAYQYHLPN